MTIHARGAAAGRASKARSYMELTRLALEDARDEARRLREGREPGRYLGADLWARAQSEVERLARWYVAGELAPEQGREWAALFREIGEAMPDIRELGLGGFDLPEGHPPLPEPGGYRPKADREPRCP